MSPGEVRIDEQVKGVVVEFEILALCVRQGTPSFLSVVVLASCKVIAAIVTSTGTIVGRNNGSLDITTIFTLIRFCHHIASVEVFFIRELEGLGADVGRSGITVDFIWHRSARIEMSAAVLILGRYDVGRAEGRLRVPGRCDGCCVSAERLVVIVDTLMNDIAFDVFKLAEYHGTLAVLEMIGGRSEVASTACLVLCVSGTVRLCVPCIPHLGIGHLVGQQIAIVMAHVVG